MRQNLRFFELLTKKHVDYTVDEITGHHPTKISFYQDGEQAQYSLIPPPTLQPHELVNQVKKPGVIRFRRGL